MECLRAQKRAPTGALVVALGLGSIAVASAQTGSETDGTAAIAVAAIVAAAIPSDEATSTEPSASGEATTTAEPAPATEPTPADPATTNPATTAAAKYAVTTMSAATAVPATTMSTATFGIGHARQDKRQRERRRTDNEHLLDLGSHKRLLLEEPQCPSCEIDPWSRRSRPYQSSGKPELCPAGQRDRDPHHPGSTVTTGGANPKSDG